jgi:hypothetical protein
VTIHRTAPLALLLSVLAPAASRAVDVPLPPPPSGTLLQSPSLSGRGYTLAFLGGFLAQGSAGSPSIQVDVGRDATPEKWTRGRFELHLPVRLARPDWSGSITMTDPLTRETTKLGTTEDSVWIVEAIPSGRLVLPVAQGFAVHAEVGVGLAVTFERHVRDEAFVGRTTERKLVLAPSINAAIGLTYQLSDRMDVVFQPVMLGRRAKADASTFSALWGLSYRL